MHIQCSMQVIFRNMILHEKVSFWIQKYQQCNKGSTVANVHHLFNCNAFHG